MIETMITERQKRHKDKMDLLEKVISVPKPSASSDHVDLFFQSITQTVKQFAPKRISEVQLKIMTLVSEMEIQNIDEMQMNNIDPSISRFTNKSDLRFRLFFQCNNFFFFATKIKLFLIYDLGNYSLIKKCL